MGELHGGAFMAIGAFVVAFSLYIGFMKMLLFVIVGVAMIIMGAVKLKGKKKKHTTHHTTHHTNNSKPPPTSHYQHRIVSYCPRCGTISHHGAYYCSRCGGRLVAHKR